MKRYKTYGNAKCGFLFTVARLSVWCGRVEFSLPMPRKLMRKLPFNSSLMNKWDVSCE